MKNMNNIHRPPGKFRGEGENMKTEKERTELRILQDQVLAKLARIGITENHQTLGYYDQQLVPITVLRLRLYLWPALKENFLDFLTSGYGEIK